MMKIIQKKIVRCQKSIRTSVQYDYAMMKFEIGLRILIRRHYRNGFKVNNYQVRYSAIIIKYTIIKTSKIRLSSVVVSCK